MQPDNRPIADEGRWPDRRLSRQKPCAQVATNRFLDVRDREALLVVTGQPYELLLDLPACRSVYDPAVTPAISVAEMKRTDPTPV